MFKKYGCLLLIIFSQVAFSATPAVNSTCVAFPNLFPKQGPLANINCDFHQLYENRLQEIIATFGAVGGRPVIMNLGGTLIFKFRGKQESVEITPLAFHTIKAYTHAIFSVYLILSKATNNAISDQTAQQLTALQKNLADAVAQLPQTDVPEPAKKVMEALGSQTQQFLSGVLKTKQFTDVELQAFFDQVRPQVNQLIYIASYIELAILNNTVNRWVVQLTPEEYKQLGVVLAVSHQARAEEISLQFFAKRFGFKYGEGAALERGFVVMENNFDEKAGLAMLARHYLDREVATAILANPDALQTDLLSKAARAILTDTEFKTQP